MIKKRPSDEVDSNLVSTAGNLKFQTASTTSSTSTCPRRPRPTALATTRRACPAGAAEGSAEEVLLTALLITAHCFTDYCLTDLRRLLRRVAQRLWLELRRGRESRLVRTGRTRRFWRIHHGASPQSRCFVLVFHSEVPVTNWAAHWLQC